MENTESKLKHIIIDLEELSESISCGNNTDMFKHIIAMLKDINIYD